MDTSDEKKRQRFGRLEYYKYRVHANLYLNLVDKLVFRPGVDYGY